MWTLTGLALMFFLGTLAFAIYRVFFYNAYTIVKRKLHIQLYKSVMRYLEFGGWDAPGVRNKIRLAGHSPSSWWPLRNLAAGSRLEQARVWIQPTEGDPYSLELHDYLLTVQRGDSRFTVLVLSFEPVCKAYNTEHLFLTNFPSSETWWQVLPKFWTVTMKEIMLCTKGASDSEGQVKIWLDGEQTVQGTAMALLRFAAAAGAHSYSYESHCDNTLSRFAAELVQSNRPDGVARLDALRRHIHSLARFYHYGMSADEAVDALHRAGKLPIDTGVVIDSPVDVDPALQS